MVGIKGKCIPGREIASAQALEKKEFAWCVRNNKEASVADGEVKGKQLEVRLEVEGVGRCDIIRNMYLFSGFILYHTAPKTLGISVKW